jgi:DNA-binding response OmpR family regulator
LVIYPEEPTMSSAAGTLHRPDPSAARGMRVLVVEDTDSVRRAVALGMRSWGFEVTAVRGGADALAVYAAVQPEVIITDLSMPGMDGFELIATLRVRGIDVPILVITARDSARDRTAAMAAGADGYLLKPFGLAELCDIVRTLADDHTEVDA